MLNRIFLMGRLTADPELKVTERGIPVINFRIAVDRDMKSRAGERETDFFSCVAFRNIAEFVSQNFGKGRPILLIGRMQERKWTAQDGTTRGTWEVFVEQVYFCDSKQQSETASNPKIHEVATEAAEPEGLPF